MQIDLEFMMLKDFVYIYLMPLSILSRNEKKQNKESSRKSLSNNKNSLLRVLKPIGATNSVILNEHQISQQLLQQIKKSKQVISDYRQRYSKYSFPEKMKGVSSDIIQLQQTISQKDRDIRQINEQIQLLKQSNLGDNYRHKKDNGDSQLFKLAQQLKNQRQQLIYTIQMHSSTMNRYEKMKESINKLELAYRQKFTDRIISYQQFKEKTEEIKKELSSKKKKSVKQLRIPQRQKLDTSIQIALKSNSQTSTTNKTMKDLHNKKFITEAALKNARKKHLMQLSELNAKLQFLRDEDALLNQKIKETELQKSHLQNKFQMNLMHRNRQKEEISQGSPSYIKAIRSN